MLTLQSVPESITRDQLCDMLRSLGIDPACVKSFSMGRRSIEAVVYATNEAGQRYAGEGNEAATHHISIAITDGPCPERTVHRCLDNGCFDHAVNRH